MPSLWWRVQLTYWGRDKMDAIFQTTFFNASSLMKMYQFRLRFHWSLFPGIQLTNIPTLVPITAWRQPGDKPLFEPMMASLLMHICVTWPQWVNNIPTLVQIMAWCLPCNKPLFEPIMFRLPMHICIIQSQRVKFSIQKSFIPVRIGCSKHFQMHIVPHHKTHCKISELFN